MMKPTPGIFMLSTNSNLVIQAVIFGIYKHSDVLVEVVKAY